MKSAVHPKWTYRNSKLSVGNALGALCLASALILPSQVSAATINFSLIWTNTQTSSDSFSGTLSVDSNLFPASGYVNLANTSATLSVTVPQLGKITYTMADLARFDMVLPKSEASKLSVGQDLMNPSVVGKVIIFGKVGSAAHTNFNQCATEYGVCFNREGQPPIYNLTSMKVVKVGR